MSTLFAKSQLPIVLSQELVSNRARGYIDGNLENLPKYVHTDHPSWKQVMSCMMYCLMTCMYDYMQDAKTSKDTWNNLKKMSAIYTTAHKHQLY